MSARTCSPPGAAHPGADRALHAWSVDSHIRLDPVGATDGTPGCDAALEHLAHQTGSLTAQSVAKMIDYPADGLQLDGPLDVRAPALAALTLTVAVGVGLLPVAVPWLRRRVRPRVSR